MYNYRYKELLADGEEDNDDLLEQVRLIVPKKAKPSVLFIY